MEQFLKKIYRFLSSQSEDVKDPPAIEQLTKEDLQVVHIENLFSQLSVDAKSLFNMSFYIFKQMQQEFDQAFQLYFMSDVDLMEPYPPALSKEITKKEELGQRWGIPNVFQLFHNFSLSVYGRVQQIIMKTLNAIEDSWEPHKGQLLMTSLFSFTFPFSLLLFLFFFSFDFFLCMIVSTYSHMCW